MTTQRPADRRLPAKVADELSNLINQMLLGIEARKHAESREPRKQDEVDYWYQYQLRAERELQALGIHLASPLE